MRLGRSVRRRPRVMLAAVLAWAALSGALAAQGNSGKKAEDAQRAEAQALVDLVEAAAKGSSTGGGLNLAWGRHYFLKAQGGKTYVPFFVVLPPDNVQGSPAVGLYLRVVARAPAVQATTGTDGEEGQAAPEAAASQYAFEDLYFFDLAAPAAGRPRRISRAFAVSPGVYDVYVAIKERPAEKPGDTPARSGVVHQEVTVPDFNVPGLTTSDIIVAENVETLPEPIDPETQADHPFTFGQMRIAPAVEHRFAKKDELAIVFWIYEAATNPATKKPDVQVDYKFHRVEGDKQTYFNRTEPQILNSEHLPAEFDLAAGHQLSGSLGVGLASFPEGEYRLEIDVQDKTTGKQVTRDIRFTVAP